MLGPVWQRGRLPIKVAETGSQSQKCHCSPYIGHCEEDYQSISRSRQPYLSEPTFLLFLFPYFYNHPRDTFTLPAFNFTITSFTSILCGSIEPTSSTLSYHNRFRLPRTLEFRRVPRGSRRRHFSKPHLAHSGLFNILSTASSTQ